jgi:hypothetical protein
VPPDVSLALHPASTSPVATPVLSVRTRVARRLVITIPSLQPRVRTTVHYAGQAGVHVPDIAYTPLQSTSALAPPMRGRIARGSPGLCLHRGPDRTGDPPRSLRPAAAGQRWRRRIRVATAPNNYALRDFRRRGRPDAIAAAGGCSRYMESAAGSRWMLRRRPAAARACR